MMFFLNFFYEGTMDWGDSWHCTTDPHPCDHNSAYRLGQRGKLRLESYGMLTKLHIQMYGFTCLKVIQERL